jgi:hypothetical protein
MHLGRICHKFQTEKGLDVDKVDYFARDSHRCAFVTDHQVNEFLVEEAMVACGECTEPGGSSSLCE